MAFASHSAWISELREQYATIGSRGPVPSGFGGLGEPQLMEHLGGNDAISRLRIYQPISGFMELRFYLQVYYRHAIVNAAA